MQCLGWNSITPKNTSCFFWGHAARGPNLIRGSLELNSSSQGFSVWPQGSCGLLHIKHFWSSVIPNQRNLFHLTLCLILISHCIQAGPNHDCVVFLINPNKWVCSHIEIDVIALMMSLISQQSLQPSLNHWAWMIMSILHLEHLLQWAGLEAGF